MNPQESSFKARPEPKKESLLWRDLFIRQHKDMIALNQVYLPAMQTPVNLNSPDTQAHLKRIYQNMVEEISELFEYLVKMPEYFSQGKNFKGPQEIPDRIMAGLHDELVDSLNFGTVFMICSGCDKPTDPDKYQHFIDESLSYFPKIETLQALENFNGKYLSIFTFLKSHISDTLMEIIYEFGMCCNMLKNRPWKKSHFPIDNPAFHQMAIKAWGRLAYAVAALSYSLPMVDTALTHKVEKNYFRLSSGY